MKGGARVCEGDSQPKLRGSPPGRGRSGCDTARPRKQPGALTGGSGGGALPASSLLRQLLRREGPRPLERAEQWAALR